MTCCDHTTLAIVGAGQLGMYLCQAARDLGIRTIVVAPEPGPATTIADAFLQADHQRDGLAAEIAAQADVVTFEFENVPRGLIDGLGVEAGLGRTQVNPRTDILRLLQDKSTQKNWLQRHGFPTLCYIHSEQPTAEKRWLADTIGFPLIQKATRGGYDGYGVQVIRSERELDRLWDTPSVMEPGVDDPEEISVVVVRTLSGDAIAFHPVRMAFDRENHVLDAMHSPTGLGELTDNAATWLAQDVIRELGGIGAFAVEMFLMPNGELVINEISPRVHNSGHHTLEAGAVSQFEQHVRAVCGMPLADPGNKPPRAVMRNLLFTDELRRLTDYPAGTVLASNNGVYLHWYGKSDPWPGRKVGHVTCLGAQGKEAERRINEFIRITTESLGEAAA